MLDANVLFPARLRDLFIRLAIAGTYRARWSELVLDECFRNILMHEAKSDDVGSGGTRVDFPY